MEITEKNLQGKDFKGQNLTDTDFSGADLRGADFTGAILKNANFSKCRTGLKTSTSVVVFLFALVVSLLSGYVAMIAGATFQFLINSPDQNLVIAGYILTGLILFFLILTLWKGGKLTLLVIALTIIAILLLGSVFLMTGAGTGLGSTYSSLFLILFVVMLTVGSIARATAGSLSSNILFFVVAIGGGMFGRSLGGGLGTIILAIACAIISKRALADKKKFPWLNKISVTVGSYFGTSFKNADLTGADFSESVISNSNFAGAKLSGVKWENAKKTFNLEDAEI